MSQVRKRASEQPVSQASEEASLHIPVTAIYFCQSVITVIGICFALSRPSARGYLMSVLGVRSDIASRRIGLTRSATCIAHRDPTKQITMKNLTPSLFRNT